MRRKFNVRRRSFLKQSAMGMIGAGIVRKKGLRLFQEENKKQPLKIKEYRLLGRTGFKVSDMGAGYMQDEGIIGSALDAGVNYLDSAEQYPGHHQLLAKVLKGRDRKSIFITTKLEIKEDKSKEGFIKRTRKCLEELETEYIDCMMMHMPEKVETLKTAGFHSAMQELKAEGRVRHVGVSNHGSFWFRDPAETMDRMLLTAAEDGRFDVFLFAYNFLKMDQAERVLKVCKEKNIGVALMKTTPIAIYYSLKSRIEQLEKEGKEIHPLYASGLKRYKDKLDRAESFIKKYNLQNPKEIKEAAVRFVLENPNVSTVCFVARTYEDMEHFIRLSGTRLSDWDRAKLDVYRDRCGELYCRHACGICEPDCPHGVPINTIMRYFHYYASQGREKEALLKYARIPSVRAEACQDCHGFCESACPYNVSIQGMLLLAHNELTLP
ncbi:MAG: aldo/keto reductase [Candidatus Aminicenantaceae bacterium]